MFINVFSFESKVFLVKNKGLVMVGCHKTNKKNIMVRMYVSFMNCASRKKIRKRNIVQIVCVNLYFHPLLTIIDIVLVIIFFYKCLQCIDIALVV